MKIKYNILKGENIAILVYNYSNCSIVDNYSIRDNKINEHKNHYSIGVWKRKKYNVVKHNYESDNSTA